ncbi:hypothetical protein UFOVP965_27 [uncultured Caudovirales phage]|uniref:Uncharacterized protein n=1 Tax=uncultured Caudovirales phage TaxID=2100421 RepID=A0A6J5PQV6_9CAUD|nr:hypothetical protein UFOVP965_27 [uncultured Caudovirales phage]CAB4179733.1 hypothetical protein UFOVP1035_23 [uncultured Caudovirales phage]CAB4188849.1 hypothetical protein UFOVP1181_129 [uncultured Caudovirales phage]
MGDQFILAEDVAIKTWLSGITVADEKNASRPVAVWFGYPDVEVREQKFPFITIDLTDIAPGNDRQTSGYSYDSDNRGTIEPAAGFVYRNQIPVAYDISYQITSYCRHPRHDRAIMYQMLNKFPSKFGFLSVPNQLDAPYTEYSGRSMFLDGFAKRDTVDGETGNRRLLRNVFSIRVLSEMTPAVAQSALQVVDYVLINQTITGIPSGYQPV